MPRRLFVFAILLAPLQPPYATLAAEQPDAGWAFSVHFENDLFASTDRQYTNGVKLTAVTPDLTSAFRDRQELPGWARSLIPHIPFIRGKGEARTLAFSLGQNIYTPEDTDSVALVPDDLDQSKKAQRQSQGRSWSTGGRALDPGSS